MAGDEFLGAALQGAAAGEDPVELAAHPALQTLAVDPPLARPVQAAGGEAQAEEVAPGGAQVHPVLDVVVGVAVPAEGAGLELQAADLVVEDEVAAQGDQVGAHVRLARAQGPAGIVSVGGPFGAPGVVHGQIGVVQAHGPRDQVEPLALAGPGQAGQGIGLARQGRHLGAQHGVAVEGEVGLEVEGGGVGGQQLGAGALRAQLLEGVIRRGDADGVEAQLLAEVADGVLDAVVDQVPQVGPEGVAGHQKARLKRAK